MKTFDYDPLWKTLKKKDLSTYSLINNYGISSRTIYNLKHNKSITVYTLVKLCEVLNCQPKEIIRVIDSNN